ncbi:MAG: hypothetical protein K5879_09715 [Lachnospiraceae bacterium]|nr:hypothetical protein [Lachnospiraceae bacterium]
MFSLYEKAVTIITDLLAKMFGVGQGSDTYGLIMVLVIVGSAFVLFYGFIGLSSIIYIIIESIVKAIVMFIIHAIPLFVMARKAGFRYPWFAFIPVLQQYLEYILPKSRFKTLFIHFEGEERPKLAIIGMLVEHLGDKAAAIAGGILHAGMILGPAAEVFIAAFSWRRMFDLIRTYSSRKVALTVSIIGLFRPIVYYVSLYFFMRRDPVYGAGKFYEVKSFDLPEEKPEPKKDAFGPRTFTEEQFNEHSDEYSDGYREIPF